MANMDRNFCGFQPSPENVEKFKIFIGHSSVGEANENRPSKKTYI
jgi:hypothetical protein